jgi:S-formylglutathione hydrolase FrmB
MPRPHLSAPAARRLPSALVLAVACAVVVALALAPAPADAQQDAGFAAECAPATEAPALVVGVVGCQRLDSEMLGGTTAFSYYIPAACAGRECPVMYYLHGTGGSYREGTGPAGSAGGAWVRALTAGPPVDPRSVDDPWRYSDLSTWVPQPALDLIIVSPHGLTLDRGHGVGGGQNPFWTDWNPRYAQGGDQQRYDTPAPRFESHLVEELLPYVDAHFPTAGEREQRGLVGYSMGGIGAMANGLKHPDLFATVGMRSGGTGPFPTLDTVPVDSPVGVAPPVAVPHQPLPGVIPAVAPSQVWTDVLYGSVATVGFGDIVVDHVWWRQSQGGEHAVNARAFGADGRQSLHLKYFVNDVVVRRAEDVAALPERYMQTVFEGLLNPMSRYLDATFELHGVERTFDVGPGDHSGTYAVAYFREQLEQQYAHMRHADGGGDPGPRADVFDHRTVREAVDIWGWRFDVDREAVEFLNLTDVSCDGLTLRGSGQVTVTVPGWCRTGLDGERTFTVDLGPGQATDEPLGVGSSSAYGRTVTVDLTAL